MRRIKLYGGDISDPRFRCFGCCHVKTGTLFLGFYHLILQTCAISGLLFALTRPEIFSTDPHDNVSDSGMKNGEGMFYVKSADRTDDDGKSGRLPELPTPQPQKSSGPVDSLSYAKSDVMGFTRKRFQNGDAHLALALLVGLLFITLMLIHGVTKNRPGYLLPFFCFQVFDLILSCLTAVGHYTWLPNLHEIVQNNPDLPYRDQLMGFDGQWMALCIMMVYVIVLLAKAYFVGVIWACYQYLHLREGGIITYTMAEDGQRNDDGELLLPPDYENALKLPTIGSPPPPYGSA